MIVYGAAFIGHDMLATNAEVLMILPASWAVVQLRDAERAASNARIVAAGLLFGTATLIKPQVGMWILAAAVAIADRHALRGEVRRAVRPLALLAAAAVAPAGLVLAGLHRARRRRGPHLLDGSTERVVRRQSDQPERSGGTVAQLFRVLRHRQRAAVVGMAAGPGADPGAGTGGSSRRLSSSRHCRRCSRGFASSRTTSSSSSSRSPWPPPRGWTR